MELTAIYHRPESEYAYLYKEGQVHIRIRTKKEDIEKILLHYGDPFIFLEKSYEDVKEMVKVTSDALFDYWQVAVSVRFARLQYLFELRDKEGKSILYGDKGFTDNSPENLALGATDLNSLIFTKLTAARFLTGFQKRSGIRFFQNDLPMEILTFLQKEL